MYFEPVRLHDILKVDESFASLVNVSEKGDLEFQFRYQVSQTQAIKYNATTVEITVLSKNVPTPSIMKQSQKGVVDSPNLVKSIITQVPNAKITSKERESYVISSKRSDISSKINNEILEQLKFNPAGDIPQLFKPVVRLLPASELRENNERPILNFISQRVVQVETTSSLNPQATMQDMVLRQGIDPSYVVDFTNRSISAGDSIGGLVRNSQVSTKEWEPSTKLLEYYIYYSGAPNRPRTTADVSDGTLVQVLVNEPIDIVEMPVTITVPSKSLVVNGQNKSNLFVRFDLIDNSTGLAVDTVTKQVNVARHMQLFFTPLKPPIVKAGRISNNRINIEIKQVDKGATAVQVYKKTISPVVEITDYTLVGTYDLKVKESVLIPVEPLEYSTSLYRIVPVGNQGAQGFEYTNVVIKPVHFEPIKSLALVAQVTEAGIQLEARRLPQRVVAIQFLRKNKTIFDLDFTVVNDTVFLVDDEVRISDFVTTLDRDLMPNNVYEYATKLIYDNGHVELTSNTLVEYSLRMLGVDTQITNVAVSHSPDPNVTFRIVTNTIDNNQDTTKKLLQQQGIYELFQVDVLKEREFLKNLIAHNIQRVNLTTGQREDFGVVTSLSFNDNELRRNQAIQPLIRGHKYRYEVTALLRAPETMFEAFVKEKIDPTTKKTYKYNPSKFMHPIALNKGILVTPTGLRTRFSKDAMSHGLVGSTKSVEVSFDKELVYLYDPAATRIGENMNVITWKTLGAVDQVDHFIIMTEIDGVRTLVGKAHSEFPDGNCQYLHKMSVREASVIMYVIVPVFNNYEVGSLVRTNPIIV